MSRGQFFRYSLQAWLGYNLDNSRKTTPHVLTSSRVYSIRGMGCPLARGRNYSFTLSEVIFDDHRASALEQHSWMDERHSFEHVIKLNSQLVFHGHLHKVLPPLAINFIFESLTPSSRRTGFNRGDEKSGLRCPLVDGTCKRLTG